MLLDGLIPDGVGMALEGELAPLELLVGDTAPVGEGGEGGHCVVPDSMQTSLM